MCKTIQLTGISMFVIITDITIKQDASTCGMPGAGLKAMATSRGCKMVVTTMFREPAAQYMEEYKTMKQVTK
jgi:hypothetical protein